MNKVKAIINLGDSLLLYILFDVLLYCHVCSMGWEWSVYEYIEEYKRKRRRKNKTEIGGKS